eukprot:2122753-Lingulodinium_polyedra.AAC.1
MVPVAELGGDLLRDPGQQLVQGGQRTSTEILPDAGELPVQVLRGRGAHALPDLLPVASGEL